MSRPTRVALARFFDLRRAEEAAERLVDRRVPDSAIQINATGLPSGLPHPDSNYWDAGMDGLRAGASFGVLFGGLWSIAVLGATAGMVLILGALIGAAFGAAIGVFLHWGRSDARRREALLDADEFHLLVDERYEESARRALRPADAR